MRQRHTRVGMVQIHLGTMTFGWAQASSPVDEPTAASFVSAFAAAGHSTIDCARIYAGGKSEAICGRVLQAAGNRDALQIVTKAHPSQKDGLTPAGLRAQVEASLAALQVAKIDLLYLHQPDTTSALSDTLATVNELLSEGTIAAFGLSNYSAVEVERCVELCKAAGYALPVAYQGLYNAINRRVEEELLPTLRANGMAFVAYNPLAAGLLTGKHVQEGEVMKGRFKDNKNYLDRFYKPDLFEGLSLVRSACEAAEISMVRATERLPARRRAPAVQRLRAAGVPAAAADASGVCVTGRRVFPLAAASLCPC